MATPERWLAKLSAVRSAVSRPRVGPGDPHHHVARRDAGAVGHPVGHVDVVAQTRGRPARRRRARRRRRPRGRRSRRSPRASAGIVATLVASTAPSGQVLLERGDACGVDARGVEPGGGQLVDAGPRQVVVRRQRVMRLRRSVAGRREGDVGAPSTQPASKWPASARRRARGSPRASASRGSPRAARRRRRARVLTVSRLVVSQASWSTTSVAASARACRGRPAASAEAGGGAQHADPRRSSPPAASRRSRRRAPAPRVRRVGRRRRHRAAARRAARRRCGARTPGPRAASWRPAGWRRARRSRRPRRWRRGRGRWCGPAGRSRTPPEA